MAKKNIKDDIEKILISGDEIEEIVGRISANVDDYYRDRDSRLLLLGILKGSVVFMGELMKKITVPVNRFHEGLVLRRRNVVKRVDQYNP